MNKSTIAILLAVVIGIVIVGAYFYPQAPEVNQNVGSPAGTTFNTARVAAINMAPVNSATSSSILNSDVSDRYITDSFIVCSGATTTFTAVTGAALASWNVKAATTSTSAPAVITNANLVLNMDIATGTVAKGVASDYGGIVYAASSTLATTTATGSLTAPASGNAAANAYKSVWAAGSYLTFWFNATSTASCTPGVHYLAS